MKHIIEKEPNLRNRLKRKHTNQSLKSSKKRKKILNKSFRMFLKNFNNNPINYKRNIDWEY